MSKFYGMVQGNRGCVTRGGSSNSGFRASCQSYDGSVITRMHYNNDNELVVSIETNTESACYGDTKFNGTFEELNEALDLIRDIKAGKAHITRNAE